MRVSAGCLSPIVGTTATRNPMLPKLHLALTSAGASKCACFQQFAGSTMLVHRTRFQFQTASFPKRPPRTTIQFLECRFRAENATEIENSKCASSARSITCDAARKVNVKSISRQRSAKRQTTVHPEIAATSTCVAPRARVSRNRQQRVAEVQETGRSKSWPCQSFTRPKNTRNR